MPVIFWKTMGPLTPDLTQYDHVVFKLSQLMFILLTIVLFSSPGSSSSLYDIENEYQEDQEIQKILEESEAGEEYVEYDEIDSKQEEILTESDYIRLFLLFLT